MRRLIAAACVSVCAALPAFAAECITSKGAFNQYKQTLAQQAAAAGVGQRGLSALANARLSDITWRFESNPGNQTGTLQGDPAKFLAKRSGSTADSFIAQTASRIARNPNTFASIERNYGVPAEILATIWGLETSWGGYLGGTSVVDGAVTLSSYCRRHPALNHMPLRRWTWWMTASCPHRPKVVRRVNWGICSFWRATG